MTASEIVGRRVELEAIDPFLDRVTGGGAALVFEGGPGIGKTTVWREAVIRATVRGYTVLPCHPVEPETKLAFASLADLFEPVADAILPHLPDPQRRAFTVALVRAAPEGALPSPRVVATAALTALRRLCDTRPVLLAIDDQQWLDRASAEALAFALRRVGNRRVGVLATARADEPRRDPLRLQAAFPTRVESLRLGPLSTSALHHVIRLHLGHVFPRPTLRRIVDTSDGNPFFALELARALIDAGVHPGAAEPLPVPDTLAMLVARRLERPPARARRVLLFAAVTAAPTVELLARAVGRADVDDALVRAEQARIVECHEGRVRFTHPLLAAAVEASATPAIRREVHARLSTLVAAPEERARHLALATARPDAAVARALDAAALLARRRGAPDAAAELLELAVGLTPAAEGAARRRRRLRAAEHLFQAGNHAHARELLEGVLADGTAGDERASALHVLGRMRGPEGSFVDAVGQLGEALACCGEARARVVMGLDLGFAVYSVGDIPRAISIGREALAEAERLGDRGLIGTALAAIVLGEFMAGLGCDDARLARAIALEGHVEGGQLLHRPSAVAGLIAGYQGRIAAADTLLRETCRWAHERGEESGVPFLLCNLSWFAWWRGDLATAIGHANEALLSAAQTGSDTMRAVATQYRGRARATQGDVAGARADLAECHVLVERARFAQGLAWLLETEGFLELSLGDSLAAARALDPLIALVEAMGVGEPITAFFLPDAVEALVGSGELARADKLLESFAERASVLDRPWALASSARCRSLLAAARGDLEAALVDAEDTVRRWDELEMPIELGRGLLALGQVRRRRTERRLAREALERARDVFAAIGARPWMDRASQELGRIPIRRGASHDLTPTEQRVAEFAGRGNTNQQVAKALFMSPKTVEANLTRIYSKLGIRSRAELGARMATRQGGGGAAKK
jgi:DNA-binding CsgD family transcriptional regulator